MTCSRETRLRAATPVLPSLDIGRTVAFYSEQLGFDAAHVAPDYAIVDRDTVELHFWRCEDPALPKASGCRVEVTGIEALHARCAAFGIVHPNAPLAEKPWGSREFAVLDPDGNIITFHADADDAASASA
ncbi:MAG: VOC family protein [Steroidobacteraceae bacterium]|jgi:catechol 2,3-dioxygenase-like lactoylglutathione lyase family enzyme|nr:VOC family protein [Steroidobacteraceae bacterium]